MRWMPVSTATMLLPAKNGTRPISALAKPRLYASSDSWADAEVAGEPRQRLVAVGPADEVAHDEGHGDAHGADDDEPDGRDATADGQRRGSAAATTARSGPPGCVSAQRAHTTLATFVHTTRATKATSVSGAHGGGACGGATGASDGDGRRRGRRPGVGCTRTTLPSRLRQLGVARVDRCSTAVVELAALTAAARGDLRHVADSASQVVGQLARARSRPPRSVTSRLVEVGARRGRRTSVDRRLHVARRIVGLDPPGRCSTSDGRGGELLAATRRLASIARTRRSRRPAPGPGTRRHLGVVEPRAASAAAT